MRLIDADALKQEVLRIHEEHFKNSKLQFIHDFFKAILRRINKAPTIDAEPVRHGRWVMRGGYIRCSECDEKTLWKRMGGTGGFSYELEQVRANYCPNCGAKMDLEE